MSKTITKPKGYGGDKCKCKKCGKEFPMKRLLREHKQWDHAVD